MKKLYSVYREAVKALGDTGCDSPEFDVQQLVLYCLGMNKTQLLLNSGMLLDEAKLIFFEECVKRRCNHEPLQYILGMWDFHRFSFKVGEGVLIPRPETELLVDFAVEQIRKNGYSVVYDLCCGSGCVGLSVAKLCPHTKVFCVDISPKAIEYTTLNKELLGADNVTVLKGDILDSVGFLGLPRPDIILSNPPYIKTEEIKSLQPELAYEPTLALDGGDDGLLFYRALADNWFTYINKGGCIAMEIGEEQGKDVLTLFLDKAQKARIIKDASMLDRVVVIKR